MISFLIILSLILGYAVFVLYAERKIAAFLQDRYGPLHVGYKGLLQSVADLLKLLQKEDLYPVTSDKILFRLAPLVIFVSVLSGFAFLPILPDWDSQLGDSSLFLMLSILALDMVGVLMAGWGSGSKFSLYGSIRGVAQILSYEIPLTLSVICVVIACSSLSLTEIAYIQSKDAMVYDHTPLFGLPFIGIAAHEWGGVFAWNIFRMPILFFAFILFFITSLAECNRAPFDIPEAESELVSGFHTEYSGFRFGMLFLGEYALMLLLCILASILFLGAWHTPFPNIGAVRLADWTTGEVGSIPSYIWAVVWISGKVVFLLFIQIMARWTYPRLRVDQLMYLCWKVLMPAGVLFVLISALWKVWIM